MRLCARPFPARDAFTFMRLRECRHFRKNIDLRIWIDLVLGKRFFYQANVSTLVRARPTGICSQLDVRVVVVEVSN